jgi:hypothetical protein
VRPITQKSFRFERRRREMFVERIVHQDRAPLGAARFVHVHDAPNGAWDLYSSKSTNMARLWRFNRYQPAYAAALSVSPTTSRYSAS